MSCDEEKWPCEYCTYKNFPSSSKCTMCGAPKTHGSEDIFQLQENVHATDSPNACAPPDPITSQNPGDWSCGKCTYLNKSRDTFCVQCRSPQAICEMTNSEMRHSSTSPVCATNLHEHIQPLRLDGCDTARSRSRNNSPPTSSTKKRGNLQKWNCSVCTYENYPKSIKCSMCGSVNQTNHIHAVPIDENDLRNERQQRIIAKEVLSNNRYQDIAAAVDDNEMGADWPWLHACLGVLEGDPSPVEAYLSSGGDPARQLTAHEVTLLNRSSAFGAGHTLVHLAIRFHREDLLATLLSQIEGTTESGIKRVPSYIAPDLAADIRRHFSASIRQRKAGAFPCLYVTELPTYALPADIEMLPGMVQEQLLTELLDKDAQQQLESEPAAINWSVEVTVRLGSRLYALWNRSAGDCLLDSAMQATWGVFDRDNALRRALSDSLTQCSHMFYPRWREYEMTQAMLLDFTLDETQWDDDWANLMMLASQPGASLEQLHIFVLAHILRRPIIVYGVKFVKSFRGEAIGLARFEGVYLPLLWDSTFCMRTPLALGYTRGHFSALVPMEPYTRSSIDPRTISRHASDDLQIVFLPLMDRDRKLLPVHFLKQSEMGREDDILKHWLDVCETNDGIILAQQRLHKKPLLVAQMTEEWLNHYRRLAQMTSAPFIRPLPVQDYSSDGETDDE